jgi:hypothetical protein
MKNNRSNKLGRFIGPATLALGLLVGNAVMGQTPVTMTRNATVIDFGGTDAWSIRQYATEDAGTDIRFDFQRITTALSTVGLSHLDPNDLVQVNVTIHFVVNDVLLTATNNTASPITYGPSDKAELFPRFTGDGKTWVLSTNFITADDEPGENVISVNDFDFLTVLNLNGITLGAGQSTSTSEDIDLLEERTVHPEYWSNYAGSGSAIGASGFVTSQSVDSQQWFAEVEYIIIPEPGTIGMMAIALGSAGAFAFLRRRKKA